MIDFLRADQERENEPDFYEIPRFQAVPKLSEKIIYEDVRQMIKARHKNVFLNTLYRFLDERKLNEVDVYRRALMDRRYFSKIRSGTIPKKNSVICLGLAMKLSEEEMDELLKSAGYAFSDARRSDVIVQWCIAHRIYNLMEVNNILYENKASLLKE